MQEFNPNLIGFALGDSLTTHKASQLNIAESGAESVDMIYMAQVLVKKIKNDPRINVQKHWKVYCARQIQFVTTRKIQYNICYYTNYVLSFVIIQLKTTLYSFKLTVSTTKN